MRKISSLISAVASVFTGGEAVATQVEGPVPPSDRNGAEWPIPASPAVIEIIDGNLRTIDYSAAIRTQTAFWGRRYDPTTGTWRRIGPGSYWRWREWGTAKDKEPFAKFPDHFKQGSAFTNFSDPQIPGKEILINPQIQQMNKLRTLQQQMGRNEFKIEPVDVQAAFEEFRNA